MLTHLDIRQFAIIEQLSLDFRTGLTVMTGETGAGKSILIGALGLVLGERSDKDTVRRGADKAEIVAEFDVSGEAGVRDWLVSEELADEDDPALCLIRRVVGADGRSRAFINQRKVTLGHLRELGAQLVEIHGQHAHYSLLRPETQRRLLDGYGQHAALLDKVKARHGDYERARKEHQALIDQANERESRLEFLRFQVGELDELIEAAEEASELTRERDRLAHSDRLGSATDEAMQRLYDGDGNAQDALAGAHQALAGILEIAPDLAASAKLVEEAEVLVGEAAEDVRRYRDRLEAEPARLEELETVLATLRGAARRHQTDIGELPALHAKLRAEMATLADFDDAVAERAERAAAAQEAFLSAAAKLTKARRKAGTALGKAITDAMSGLGLANGNFVVDLASDPANASANGADAVTFAVTTNAGQPPRPLAKVASGGELARISLALQVILSAVTAAPTLVFDEVDAGIGGAVAEIVGRRLRELGAERQVLCVTHLAQVASCGESHYRVSKRSLDDTTRTDIRDLDDDERTQEIARMLGGVELTDATLTHAAEMLAAAGKPTTRRKRA